MDEGLATAVATIEERKRRRMGAHFLWYVPLCLTVTGALIAPAFLLGCENVRALVRHFTWGIFFSPSFYVFAGVTISSITVPINILKSIPKIFVQSEGKRFTAVMSGIALIVFWSAAFQVVSWGSYPLGYDKQGYEHLRLIPFIPWPTDSLLHWIFG